MKSLDRSQFWLLLILWMTFSVFVALEIHGSSVGLCAGSWRPEKKYEGFLFAPLLERFQASKDSPAPYRLKNLFAMVAQPYRRDEFMIFTPAALSQFSHEPRFPLRNSNIGTGQNMLLLFSAPVLHPATLVRPATWGFLLLGPERGLAWLWWFQPFACFTVLVLLFNILVPGRPYLSILGASWFCLSACVICWSNFPEYVTFFPALGFVCLYHLIVSLRPRVQMLCGVLLGLSLPGFFLAFHPPYQVSLGLLFLLLFIGVALRDRLRLRITALSAAQKASLAGAVLITILLGLSIADACLPELRLMTQSQHFGSRISSGGGMSLPVLFKGFFNYKTNEVAPSFLGNPCEAASFLHLFPVILLALPFSRRIRQSLDLPSRFMLAAILAIVLFMLIGVPESVARLTLLSYVTSTRADLALGLASIFLCISVLAKITEAGMEFSRWGRALPWIAGILIAAFQAWNALQLQHMEAFSSTRFLIAAAALAGILSALLLAGKSRAFAALLVACLLGTSFEFNPLCRGLDGFYDSQLADSIQRLDAKYGRPVWLCYGDPELGILATVVGARSLSGFHLHPQPMLWSAIDPAGEQRQVWNRYGYVSFLVPKSNEKPAFALKLQDDWSLTIAPDHPAFRALGARLLLTRSADAELFPALHVVEKPGDGAFTIYELPME